MLPGNGEYRAPYRNTDEVRESPLIALPPSLLRNLGCCSAYVVFKN